MGIINTPFLPPLEPGNTKKRRENSRFSIKIERRRDQKHNKSLPCIVWVGLYRRRKGVLEIIGDTFHSLMKTR
jgi:hypothetical protein